MATVKKRSDEFARGKSVNDLLSMNPKDFMKLNERELRLVVTRLSSAANKRLRAFEQQGETSPAYRQAKEGGTRFGTAGKSFNELRAEFKRVKGFMTAQTGTVGKWKKVRENTIEKLKKQNVNITPQQFDKFFRTYENLKSADKSVSNRGLKYAVLTTLQDAMEDKTKSVDALTSEMQTKITNIYEGLERNDSAAGVSGFFTM